jgi:hypothetical protein
MFGGWPATDRERRLFTLATSVACACLRVISLDVEGEVGRGVVGEGRGLAGQVAGAIRLNDRAIGHVDAVEPGRADDVHRHRLHGRCHVAGHKATEQGHTQSCQETLEHGRFLLVLLPI